MKTYVCTKTYIQIFIGFIHNSKKLETTICHQLGNGQTVVCPYNGVLLSNKRSKILVHLTMWMSLKRVMLSERCQTQETPYSVIPFIWHSVKGRTIGTNQTSVAKDLGVRGVELTANRHEGKLFGVMGMFYILIVVVVTFVKTCWTIN